MGARFRSWWQNIRKPLDAVIITLLVVLLVLIGIVIIGYLFNWGWTGLGPYTSPPHPKDSDFQRGKTLWDWLQLLIIPAVLALGGYLFNYTTSKSEREIASDRQREDTLQSYIDKISELMLRDNLRESADEEVRKIARVRTLTALRRLDAERKGSVIRFLHESGLIDKDKRIIDLSEADLNVADLRKADLSGANLGKADLFGADLSGADLSGADLSGADLIADLSEADLSGADLSGAILSSANLSHASLSGANLDGANLDGATVTPEQLDTAHSLKDTNMPDGSKHP